MTFLFAAWWIPSEGTVQNDSTLLWVRFFRLGSKVFRNLFMNIKQCHQQLGRLLELFFVLFSAYFVVVLSALFSELKSGVLFCRAVFTCRVKSWHSHHELNIFVFIIRPSWNCCVANGVLPTPLKSGRRFSRLISRECRWGVGWGAMFQPASQGWHNDWAFVLFNQWQLAYVQNNTKVQFNVGLAGVG